MFLGRRSSFRDRESSTTRRVRARFPDFFVNERRRGVTYDSHRETDTKGDVFGGPVRGLESPSRTSACADNCCLAEGAGKLTKSAFDLGVKSLGADCSEL